MMPKKDGFTLAEEIRVENKQIPIIFLTAKSQTKDVVKGFTIGGNDYLKKPFSMEELIVRIKSLLNRESVKTTTNTKRYTNRKLYFLTQKKQLLSIKNTEQQLTSRESDLLLELYLKKNKILDSKLHSKKIVGKR